MPSSTVNVLPVVLDGKRCKHAYVTASTVPAHRDDIKFLRLVPVCRGS